MPLPTAPTGLVATASAPSTGSGQATVALSWTANPSSNGIIEYRVYRTPTTWFMPKTVAAVVGTACTDNAGELLPNTGWYYFVIAVNAAGTSPASATANVTIPQDQLSVPSAPAGLAATANSNDTVSLSWNANPASQAVTGYNVYRETSGSSSATLVATVSGTSYTDGSSALTAGSSWSYHLTAINAAGTSPASSSVIVAIPSTGNATFLAPFQVSNYGTSTMPAGAQVTFAQPLAPGDVPSTNSIQIRAADGKTVLGSFQQDQESTWLQDGSCKVAALSFLPPDTFAPPVQISSLTWNSGTATVITAAAHGLPSGGGLVTIQNAGQDCWNGVMTYSYLSADSFSFALPSVTVTATATNGSTVLTGASSIAGLNSSGLVVSGPGIPSGTTVISAGSGTIWVSQPVSGLSTGPSSGPYTFTPPATGTTSISTVSGTANATAAQVVEYQLWSAPSAKSQSANVTLATVTANSDIKLYFTGYDLGADTWEVSVNDIYQQGHGAAWAPTNGAGWGANPTRGWEVIRSGPVCTEWRLWSVLRRLSDGAWHPWLRGWIYLRCWGMNGGGQPILEISGGWMQPNSYGPNQAAVVVSTSNGPDFVFATWRAGQNPTAGSGWTAISGADYLLTEYETFSSAQSNIVVATGSGSGPSQGITDAIVNGSLDTKVHATNGGATASSMALPALSTSGANRVIVVCFLANGYGGSSVTSTSGLSFMRRLQDSGTNSGVNLYLEEWYAVASSQLSNEVITINLAGSGTYITADAFSVAGANTSSASTIFDTNLPHNITATITEPSYIFAATLYDGNTALNYWGGAQDYRTAFTAGTNGVPLNAATVNTSAGEITVTQAQFNALYGIGATKGGDNGGTYGGGVGGRIPVTLSVSSGGSLPGGLSAYDGTRNTVYWIAGPYNQGNTPGQFAVQFFPNADYAFNVENNLSFTSTGSGTMTITPAACSFSGASGLALDPATVGRTWRNGTKPTLLVGHDFTYLTTKSRVLPPYLANTVVAHQTAFAPTFSQGCTYYAANIGGYGDGDDDDRIGYLIEHNAQELYRPFDGPLHQQNLAIAASWIEVGGYLYADETTGLSAIPVNATTYSYLAAPQPGGGDNSGTFTVQGSTATIDNPGGSSEVARDHSPCPEVMPYLKTGDYLYIDSLLLAQNSLITSIYNNSVIINGVTYYRPWTFVYYNGSGYTQDALFGKGRGMAWCCRTLGFGLHLFPATRPEMPYFRDMMSASSQLLMELVNTGTQTGYVPAGMQTLGVWCGINPSPANMPASLGYVGPDCETERWMDDWQFASFAVMAWRGEYPGFLNWLQNYFYRGTIGRVDENPAISGQPPGFIWAINMAQTSYLVGKTSNYDTWAQTWDDVYTWTALEPSFAGGANFTATATVTQNSGIIIDIDSNDLNTWAGGINPAGGLRYINTIPNFDFPDFTTAETLDTTNATCTVTPWPGTYPASQAVASRSETGTEIIVSRIPVPWPGIASMKATYPTVMNNQLNIGTPGGDFPDSENGYPCYLTWALGMAKVLYDQSGGTIPAFQNAEAIYNEIRRRQGQGSSPYDPYPLSFRNYPKYGIGYIGASS